MMKRKVARIGPSTLMVSLPSKWVKQHHIQKGHELDLQEKEGTLVIHPADAAVLQQAEIRLEKKDQFLKRYIRSLYHRGFTEVKIVCDEGIDINKIKEKLDIYVGFEIIEQGKNYCIIRNVADTIEGEFDAIISKIFLMNRSMAEGSLEHIQRGEYDKLGDIAEIEKTNNKLINLSYRIINKSGKFSDPHMMYLYTILLCLENIADHYSDLCLYVKNKKPKISNELQQFHSDIAAHYRELSHLYYKFDKTQIVAMKNKRIELLGRGHQMYKKVSREESLILHYLLSIINEMKDIELSIGFTPS